MNKNKKILLGIILALLSFSFFVVFTIDSATKENEKFLKDMIVNEATSYYNNIIDTRKWNAMHGGVYVKQKEGLEVNKYLKDNHIYTKDGELLVKINPAWMTRQIAQIANESNENYFKLTSLKPINPINKPDEFERKALMYFEKNKNEKFYKELSDDFSKFNFMGSLKVTSSCLSCHQSQGYEIGDIRGGIRISIPTKKYYENLEKVEDKESKLKILVLIVTGLLITAFIFLMNRLAKNDKKIRRNIKEINELEKTKENLLLRYEHAIEGTKDGLWDWDLETNNVFFSKNWKSMLGYKDYEIENRLEEWDIRVHPDDKEQAIKDIKDNHNKLTKFYQSIHRLRHKDGSWIWILDRGKTYFNDEGKPIRMVGFHSDITELKNLEMNLKKAKKELTDFKLIIESAPITIVITNTRANIIYVNPHFCKISGYSEDEILGKNPSILKYEDTKNEAKKFKELWRTVLRKQPWGGIFRNKAKNGSEYWETATVLPILDSKGNIVNYLGIMREITKEIYLEKELKEKEELMLAQSKNAAMGEMISMIAHQWRQPITAISMSANNIIADIELDEFDIIEARSIAENIAEQTQFLSKTIDDFRNFFKEDKEMSVFKVSDLINELSTIMLASLKNNNIVFDINYEENLELKTHKRELLQVLLNLIKNAKEALCEKTKENRYIKIDVEKKNGFMLMSILDNGGGIKEENLDKIFNAYFSTKNDYNGTGLGLYMSKIIVEKHLKGTISVFNKDGGANFILKIKQSL